MHADPQKVAFLEARIKEYQDIIAAFERSTEQLRQRRRNAADPVMEFCDSHIALNQRTIDSMRQGLQFVRKQLNEQKQSSDFTHA
jgi:hypothetical protein